MTRNDNFSKQADLYAKYRPSYPKALYDFILTHMNEREAAWDCGTGSGQVAAYLASYFGVVYASDISPQQLNYAAKKKSIEYAVMPAEQTDYASESFDLITVAQAIHWFNFDRFYKEVNRTAKNNALLAVIGYGMLRINEGIDPLLDECYRYAFGTYFSESRHYIEEQYQTIPFPFEEIESPLFSISYKWSLTDLEGVFNSWSAIQKFKEEAGVNPADDFIDRLKNEAGWESNKQKEVTFPIFMRLGIIRK